MNFTIAEVDPFEIREAAIDFFWRLRAWPFTAYDDYARAWDWRYGSLSDGNARVWVARSGDGAVAGHIAAYPRRFRFGSRTLHAIVPGNFVVHPDQRNTLIGPRLAMQPKAVVRRGEAEFVLAFGNEAAHQMFMRQGFTDLGGFREYLDIHRWGPLLRRRFRPAVLLAPALDAAFAARRALRGGHAHPAKVLSVRRLSEADVRDADLGHWAPSPFVEAAGSAAYLGARFLTAPHHPRQMLGIVDDANRLEAYVVLTAKPPFKVWECRVNHAVIGTAAALRLVARHTQAIDRLSISVLASSALAASLRERAFIERTPGDYEASRSWSIYVPPAHELAQVLTDPGAWAVQYGSTHY